MAYHGYVGPVYTGDNDPAQYNGNSSFQIGGIAEDINFVSSFYGDEIFPGQTQTTNVAKPAYAVVYQGYFLAPDTASYTLTSPESTDDFAYIWTGDKAKSTWSNTNYDAESQLNTYPGSITFPLTRGEEIPVTIVWVNAANAGGLNISISNSATGLTVNDTTGYFVSPKASDGFSNGVGTLYYSASGTSTTAAGSSATQSAVSESGSGSSGIASASASSGIAATSSEIASSSAAVASSSSGASATSSGASASATSGLSTVPGFVYGAFNNPSYTASDKADSIAFFNSDSNSLVSCGISTTTNFGAGTSSTLPGQSTSRDLSHIAVVYHGYFQAPLTGQYYFGANSAAFSYIWYGQDAQTAWTSSNWAANDSAAHPTDLTAGEQLPMTLLYVNDGSGSGNAYFNVRLPNGTYEDNLGGLLFAPKDGETWSPIPISACTVPTSCDSNGFSQYYFGSGYVYAEPNYDSTHSPTTIPYPANQSEAAILSDCAASATSKGYQHLDIHYDSHDGQWYCVQYHTADTDTAHWSNAMSQVTAAFGYSHCP